MWFNSIYTSLWWSAEYEATLLTLLMTFFIAISSMYCILYIFAITEDKNNPVLNPSSCYILIAVMLFPQRMSMSLSYLHGSDLPVSELIILTKNLFSRLQRSSNWLRTLIKCHILINWIKILVQNSKVTKYKDTYMKNARE